MASSQTPENYVKLIQLGDYHYFNYDAIGVIRESPLDEDQTIIFLKGSSATDGGFLVDLPIEDVLEELEDARLQLVAQDMQPEDESPRETSSVS